MIRQTWAIFFDAYRELNHKKMFWISLVISLLVVASFAMVGINEQGITVLWFELPLFINSQIISQATFYKFIFSAFGVDTWLGLAAMALALISTASVMPDFVSAGSIEMTLSRPISRLRLFLTKYITAMLFVFLQVLVFSLAAVLVIGLRGGEWLFSILWAVPLVTLMFSYLYSISVLVGIITRSSVTALVTVAICWVLIGLLNTVEISLLQNRVGDEVLLRQTTRKLADREVQYQRESERAVEKVENARTPEQLALLKTALEKVRSDHAQQTATLATKVKWHNIFYSIKLATPKNGETLGLLKQILVAQADMDGFFNAANDQSSAGNRGMRARYAGLDGTIMKETDQRIRDRGWLYVLGTSLLFELLLVGIAARIFCKRDF